MYHGLMSNQRKRPQNPKPRNQGWAQARIDQSNMNLTVPSGKVRKRAAEKREWKKGL